MDELDQRHLGIDPTVCDGAAMCAMMAPSLISMDRWGFPIVSEAPLDSPRLLGEAERAVGACPRKALFISGGPSGVKPVK